MNNANLLASYPRLSPLVKTMHLNPETSLIVRRRIGDESNPISFHSPKRGDEVCEYLNKTAALLLLSCDGSKTIEAIAAATCTTGDRAEFESDAAEFLANAAERQYIELLDSPGPQVDNVRITGSMAYSTPFHISVELTNKCNLRCAYCYTSFMDREQRLSTAELLETLSEWKDLGLQSLELTGGEVLLHEGFWEIMDFCYNNFRRVALLTNGTLITEEKAQRLATYRTKLVVGISLDGGSAESHERTRGPHTFDRTVAAIKWLKSFGVRIRLGMTLTPSNSYDLMQAAELARSLNVDYFSFTPVMSYGRGEEVSGEWTAEQTQSMERLMERALKEFSDIIPSYPIAKLDKVEGAFGNCGLGHKNLTLTPSGKLKACLFLSEADYIGDVRKERLVDIFQKSLIDKFRDLRNPSFERCGPCKYAKYCFGCTARALVMLDKEKRLCEWAHTYAIGECFPRYGEYAYDPQRPYF
jgi:radical SAM protein with 4Fe4S-binding SPASM domain